MTDQPEQPPVPPVPPVPPLVPPAVPPAGPAPAPSGWSSEQPPAYPGPAAPPPPGWGNQPVAPKPGVIPLRPLTVGEILDGAITTIRQYWRPMIGLAFIVSTGLAVVSFLASLLDLRSATSTQATSDVAFYGGGIAQFLSLILTFVGGTLLTGMLTVVVGQAVLGRDTTASSAWDRIRPLGWRLVGLTLLVSLVVLVGSCFCLIPGLVLATFYVLSPAALVLERGTVTGALSRSWNLVKGAFWRTLGIVVLVWILRGIITAAVLVPFTVLSMVILFAGAGATGDPNAASFIVAQAVIAIGSIIAGSIGYPFIAAALSLTYIDRRMRSEGLDIELARASAGQA
ncbi:MAG: YciC family protein [Actinomycetes bacterium]